LPISTVKNQLSELVESARTTCAEYTITVNGVPAAVLVGADEWESLQETAFWSSQPAIMDDVVQARASRGNGASLGESAIRQRYGLSNRD